jgi:hypothetical protein
VPHHGVVVGKHDVDPLAVGSGRLGHGAATVPMRHRAATERVDPLSMALVSLVLAPPIVAGWLAARHDRRLIYPPRR